MICNRILTVSLYAALMLAINTGVASEKWEFLNAVSTVAYKYECDKKIPGFKERTDKAYEAWLKYKIQEIEALDDNLLLTLKNKQSDHSKTTSNQELAQLRKNCDKIELSINSFIQPIDPRRSTPEGTWKLYLQGLREGDSDLAISCLTNSARDNWAKVFKELDSATLKQLSKKIKSFSMLKKEVSSDFRTGIVTRHDGRVVQITFFKERDEWKISQL